MSSWCCSCHNPACNHDGHPCLRYSNTPDGTCDECADNIYQDEVETLRAQLKDFENEVQVKRTQNHELLDTINEYMALMNQREAQLTIAVEALENVWSAFGALRTDRPEAQHAMRLVGTALAQIKLIEGK